VIAGVCAGRHRRPRGASATHRDDAGSAPRRAEERMP